MCPNDGQPLDIGGGRHVAVDDFIGTDDQEEILFCDLHFYQQYVARIELGDVGLLYRRSMSKVRHLGLQDR